MRNATASQCTVYSSIKIELYSALWGGVVGSTGAGVPSYLKLPYLSRSLPTVIIGSCQGYSYTSYQEKLDMK